MNAKQRRSKKRDENRRLKEASIKKAGEEVDLKNIHAPRQDDQKTTTTEKTTEQETKTTPRQETFILNIPPPPPNPRDTHKEKQETAPWYKNWRTWKKVIQVFAVVSGIGYAVITWLQWRTADNSYRLGSRAYLGIEAVQVIQTAPHIAGRIITTDDKTRMKLGNQTVILVTLKNTGNTPANSASGWMQVATTRTIPTMQNDTLAHPVTVYRHDPEERIGLSSVNKDSRLMFEKAIGLKDAEISTILDGKLFLVVFGRVQYYDVFQAIHHTTFCAFYSHRLDEFASCGTGNSMN